MRYFIQENENSLKAIVSLDLAQKPINAVDITDLNRGFRKPYFTDNTFTEVVETITAEEIANAIADIEDAEDLAEQLLLDEAGQQLIYRTKKRLLRRRKKGLITANQAKKVREILNPIFQFLKTGDLDIANDKAILLAVDANANVQAELVWFKARILEIQ